MVGRMNVATLRLLSTALCLLTQGVPWRTIGAVLWCAGPAVRGWASEAPRVTASTRASKMAAHGGIPNSSYRPTGGVTMPSHCYHAL